MTIIPVRSSGDHADVDDATYNLISFLGAIQGLGRHILPIPLYYDKDTHSGGTANVRHALLSNDVGLSFKRVRPESLRGHSVDWRRREAQCYRILIDEVRHLFMSHPNIISLLGVAWETEPSGKVWPVLVSKRAHHENLKIFMDGKGQSSTWEERLGFVIDLARGLEFIHSASSSPIAFLPCLK